MFSDIRKFHDGAIPDLDFTMLAVQITGQPSEDVGHLTPGLNYKDASITCAPYDKNACYPYTR